MNEGVILWNFNLRDGMGWGTGSLTSTKNPLGFFGTPLVRLTWYFLSLYSLALTRMFLGDFPLLYTIREEAP